MTIHYELTEEDFIQFNLHYIVDSPAQKNVYWFLRIIIPLLFSGLIFLIGTVVFRQPSIYWIISGIGIFGLSVLYFPEQYRKTILKQTKKRLKTGDTGTLLGEKTLTLSDSAITVTGEDIQEALLLNEILRVEEYKDMILIYNSKRSALIVPKRQLKWEEIRILANLK